MEDVGFFIDVLENQPPYKGIEISQQNYIDLAESKSLKIESYCTTCQKEQTFCQNNLDAVFQPLKRELLKHSPMPGGMSCNDVKPYKSCFLTFVFCCAYCGEEHFYAIRIDDKSIYKIGQYPSFSRLETASLRKYKNLIKEYYVELTSAINAYSQNMGIAAFVYLRRILEHLIDAKYSILPDANEETKFIDKLKAVEATETVIPEVLAEIKEQIYSVLSKGIHEYTEKGCLDLFEAVLYVITSILDRELYKREQAAKAAEAKKMIAQKLKEPQKEI